MGEGPNRGGSSRRWAVQAVEGSPKRLRTDYIDLYRIHHPDPYTDIEETLSALTDLVRAGKVRAIGSSDLPYWKSSKPSGCPSGVDGTACAPSSPPTPSSTAASSGRSCPPATATAYAFWCGARWPGLLTGRYRKNAPRPENARTDRVPRHLADGRKLDAVLRTSLPHPHGPAPTPVPRAIRRVRMP